MIRTHVLRRRKMRPKGLFLMIALAALFCAPLVSPAEESCGGEKIGEVDFPVSCNDAAQTQLDRGVALLHSFWYEEAVKAFTAGIRTDSGCAMGYWGIAMSLWHPLWPPPNEDAVRGQMAVAKAEALGGKTEREKDYIAAIAAFYKDADKLDQKSRALAYRERMEKVALRYPEDREAAAFYALALLTTADPSDKTFATQEKAAKILEKIYAEEPNHPGAAHYLIHAYDYPSLAGRALEVARNYAKIAPSVPHALHMPSHIFTRLGLWQESIESNLSSLAATRREGSSEMALDDRLHAMDYLEYAYLQVGLDRAARGIVDELNAFEKMDHEDLAASYALAAIPARYAIEREDWAEAASLEVRPSQYPATEAITHFARALGAARRGDVAEAGLELKELQALQEALVRGKQAYWAEEVEIQGEAAAAWLAHAEGKEEEALRLMRSAVDLDDEAGKHPVTPGPIVPARELLGELLLELNQPAQALKEFEASLEMEPNRFHGLYGAGRSAERAGDLRKARSYYTRLVTICGHADTERPRLKEAKEFLARHEQGAGGDPQSLKSLQ